MFRRETDIHYQFIELLAYWQGTINSTDLVNYFKISRQQAHKYLKHYQGLLPANLTYHQSKKVFIPTSLFKAFSITDDAAPYLNWLSQTANEISFKSENGSVHTRLTNTALTLPTRQVSPLIMRGLVCAMKEQRRLEVDYVSLTNPNQEGRIIQPYVFVKTGLRWHLRAYDEKNQAFRDFVLSRFRAKPELLDKATHFACSDKAWNTIVELNFIADQRLSQEQQQVIEHDYQMHNGRLVIQTRAALVQYLLQEMQVNTKFHDEYPEAQQLVLANKKDIKQWLFNG
jgi:predicted DNA-binding transcriptional regulator YafY